MKFLAPFLMSFVLSCSSPHTAPQTTSSSCALAHHRQSQSITQQKYGGPTWSLEVPMGWHAVDRQTAKGSVKKPNTDGTKTEVLLETDADLKGGRGMASVMTVPWGRDPETFALAAARSFSSLPGVEVLDVSPVDVTGTTGVAVLAVIREDGAFIVQLSVAHGGMGHVIRCGGSLSNSFAVDQCAELVGAFSLRTSV